MEFVGSETISTLVRRDPRFIGDDHSIELQHFYVPEHYQDTLDCLLITYGEIVDRTEKLAYDISLDYTGQTIHLLCVLKGKLYFKLLMEILLIDAEILLLNRCIWS